jgi:AI-2 transport protein TqsA
MSNQRRPVPDESPENWVSRLQGFGPIQRWFIGLVAMAIVLVILVQARFFLIPLAMAILLFSLTSAAIDFFARMRIGSLRIPYWLASVVAMVVIISVLMAMFGMLAGQFDTLMVTAPAYADRIQETVAELFAWLGEDVAQSVLVAFQEINIGAYTRAAAGSAGSLLMAIVLVILYVGFLFAERPWFPAKISRLFPEPERAAYVNHVIDSIGYSVRHYMLVKTAVSAVTALVVYAVLSVFGLDFAETLAMLAFVLNFIPNIGSIVATALPTLVALVQFDGWTMVMAVLIVVGTVQFSVGNVLEPMLMGRALNLSSFAIILSLTFWGAVWGVVGMFLAVPLTVIVMIVCSNVPALKPFAILLSREGRPVGEDGEMREESPTTEGGTLAGRQ